MNRGGTTTRTGNLYSPQFGSQKETKMVAVELNDRHLRFHGKIGDCEQSNKTSLGSFLKTGFREEPGVFKRRNGEMVLTIRAKVIRYNHSDKINN